MREPRCAVMDGALQFQARMDGQVVFLPERPGERDCLYYMRTGECGYGINCRFNHPPYRKTSAIVQANGDYPQRIGQPECQYYLKTGTCKFGGTCKFHHPKDIAASAAGRAQLNALLLPLRPGEMECAYYMRTGTCKFGPTCKFHHPQPSVGTLVPMAGGAGSHSQQFESAAASHSHAPWQMMAPRPFLPAGQRMQPLLLPSPQGVMSITGWNAYRGGMGAMNNSREAKPQPIKPTAFIYGAGAGAGAGAGSAQEVQYVPTATVEATFPERPGQPECQYYTRTGDCKFGASCKFHHPKHRALPSPTCVLSPLGLPIRPGAQTCAFYSKYGYCKFGLTCKFDHPYVTLSPMAAAATPPQAASFPRGGGGVSHSGPLLRATSSSSGTSASQVSNI